MQSTGHRHVQVASVYGEGLFETLYKQVLWSINESPWLMIPNQQHWFVPKHVTLWHKTLVILPATFPIDRTHDKQGILRLSWSRRVRESPRVAQVWSEKSFLSLVQEFFGCKQHGTATCRLQVHMGKSCLKRDHKLHLHKQAGDHSWITLAYDSYPSNIGLSQDMWHCGRKCL